jgi:hypothetical protein
MIIKWLTSQNMSASEFKRNSCHKIQEINYAWELFFIRVLNCCTRSWVNSVAIATGYRLDSQGSIPERGKRFLCFPQHPDSREILPVQLRHSIVASIVCYWSSSIDVASGIESVLDGNCLGHFCIYNFFFVTVSPYDHKRRSALFSLWRDFFFLFFITHCELIRLAPFEH